MNDVEGRLAACFSAVFPNRSAEEIPTADRDSWAEWDSLAGIMLLTVLQQEFQLEVDPLDLERLSSFGSLLEYIVERPALHGGEGGG